MLLCSATWDMAKAAELVGEGKVGYGEEPATQVRRWEIWPGDS